MVADDIKVYLRAETKAAVAAMKRAQKQTNSLESSLGSMVKTAVKTFGAYAAAAVSVRAVTKTIKDSVAAYGKQIAAEQGLQAALHASGESAEDLMPQLKGVASAIQSVTTVGDEAVLGLMQMAKSQGVATGQLEQAAKAAIGLTEAYGGGMQDNIRKVSRALQGDVSGLQELIPAMRTASTEAQKQAIAQKAMADSFDIAKAKADNGVAAIQQYKNAAGDLSEQLGQTVAEGARPFIDAMTDFASRTAAAIDRARELKGIIEALKEDPRTVGLTGLELALDEARKKAQQWEDEIRQFNGEAEASARIREEGVWKEVRAIEALIQQRKIEADYQNKGAEGARLIAEQNDRRKEAQDRRNEEANKKRLELAREYSDRIAQQELSSLHLIEYERKKALEDAKASHLEKGSEIDQINKYFDNRRQEAMESETAKLKDEQEKRKEFLLNSLRERGSRRIELQRQQAIMVAQVEAERIAETERLEKESMARRRDMMFQLAGYAGQMANTISSIVSNMYAHQIAAAEGDDEKQKELKREQAMAQKRWAMFESILNTSTAITKTMASVPFPYNIPLAGAQAALGSAQVAAIASQPIPAFARGGDFVTSGPQMIMVGDNPGGRERVRIDPQPDSRSSSGVTIVINSLTNYGPGGAEGFAKYMVDAINRGQRSGRVERFIR